MFGSVFTLRSFGLVLALIAGVFSLMALNSALQTRMSETQASGIIAAVTFLVAACAWGIAAIREHNKKQQALRMVQRLLHDSPITGLVAAAAAGAAARFGINADDAVHWISALIEPEHKAGR